jgi:hypothetical protein
MPKNLEYLNSINREELKILIDFYYQYFKRSARVRLDAIDGFMDGDSTAIIARDLQKTYALIRTYLHDADRNIRSIRKGYKLG